MKPIKKHIKLKDLNLKNNGFITPINYFNSLETKIFLKLNNDIPLNYFKTVESKILSKLEIDNESKVKVISLKSRFIKQFIPSAVAASVILFIGLNLFNKSNINTIDKLDLTVVNDYLDVEYESSYALGELLNSDDFSSLSNNYSIIETTNLETYLTQTNLEELMLNN